MRGSPQAALVAGALALLSHPALSHAQSSSAVPGTTAPPAVERTERQQQAVRHYERAQTYYAAGRYRMAAGELEAAIANDPSGTNLYFDLGLVYERLGRADRALQAFRLYRARVQDAGERERSDRILRRLSGARAELAAVQGRRGRADAWFWATTGVAMGTALVGTVLLVTGVRTDAWSRELMMMGAPPMEVMDTQARASVSIAMASTFLAATGVLGVASVLLYFTRDADPPPLTIPRLGMSVGVGPGNVSLQLRF